MPKKSNDGNMQVRLKLLQGVPLEQVVETERVPVPTARKIQMWLASPPGKDWTSRHYPEYINAIKPNGPASVPIQKTPPSIAQPQVVEITPDQLEDIGQPVASSLPGEVPEPQPEEPIIAPPPPPRPAVAQRKPQMVVVKEGQNGMQILGRPQGGIISTGEDQLRVDSPPAAIRGRGTVNVTPLTLLWYDYVRAEGYPEDLPTFIEEGIVGYMASKGRKFVMVMG